MFDRERAGNLLVLVDETISRILHRTSAVDSVDDFLSTEGGMILLDSVCMNLAAIGESIKSLDKITDRQFLEKYPEINWKDVMGMRDIIVHHYFDIDADVVLCTLKENLPQLQLVLKRMRADICR